MMCPPKTSSERSVRGASEAAKTSGKGKADGNSAELPKREFPVVKFSPLPLLAFFSVCAAGSFYVGSLSRDLILSRFGYALSPAIGIPKLNLPGIPTEKRAPHNKYTSKQFDASSDVWRNSILQDGQCQVSDDETCVLHKETDVHESTDPYPAEGNIYEPSGQHLLIDIENVDPEFLNSEERLATAMIELVNLSTLTLLSYHCTRIHPMGVSCVGVLLESHISFRTWPLEGVIHFDLFSCGPVPLLPLVPTVKAYFGVPRPPPSNEEDLLGKVEQWTEKPRMVWGHKRRGFRTRAQYNIDDADIHWILGSMNLFKEHVATVKTNFQLVDIYDIVDARFKGKDRVVFLDGIIQSRSYGEQAYHEALVHPALFAHDNPQRVIIIGGGEGATLREVLKHNTVQQVIMVEIDQGMVETSKHYLPGWSDCSNLVGSADSCFDDPRATLYFEDAIAWFIKRFGVNATVTEDDMFDVIVMDALDPNSVVEFSDLLYNNDELTDAFSRALGEEGIFVAQVGEADEIDDPQESLYPDDHFMSFVNGLRRVGFESIVDYEEAHGRLVDIWAFVLAMKDGESRANWFMGEAEINLKIQKRAMKTKNGVFPFNYFDGATMMQYQFSSRVVEEVWCRDKTEECGTGHGFNPEISNIKRSAFEVKPSTIAMGGRGVFATEFIAKGSHILLEECVHGMFIPGTTYNLMGEAATTRTSNMSDFWDVIFWGYVDGYGWVNSGYGLPTGGVDPGILTFTNHGCNGQYNIGDRLKVNEMTMEIGVGSEGIFDDSHELYHPYLERHYPNWSCGEFVALRDIEVGEELLDNYLVFGGGDDIRDWEENLKELKSLCTGGTGFVASYEKGVED